MARKRQDRSIVEMLQDAECTECSWVDLNLSIDCPDAPECPPGLHRHQSPDLSWIEVLSEAALQDASISAAITGKYLFFSDSLAALLSIAHRELAQHGFHRAKLPPRKPPNRGLVLCLYSP